MYNLFVSLFVAGRFVFQNKTDQLSRNPASPLQQPEAQNRPIPRMVFDYRPVDTVTSVETSYDTGAQRF